MYYIDQNNRGAVSCDCPRCKQYVVMVKHGSPASPPAIRRNVEQWHGWLSITMFDGEIQDYCTWTCVEGRCEHGEVSAPPDRLPRMR